MNDNIAVASTPKNQVDNKYAPIILSHISKVRKAVTSIDNVNPWITFVPCSASDTLANNCQN